MQVVYTVVIIIIIIYFFALPAVRIISSLSNVVGNPSKSKRRGQLTIRNSLNCENDGGNETSAAADYQKLRASA